MEVYILVDGTNIVRCMASEEGNLHADKLYMDQYYVECGGTVGDEYNPSTSAWTACAGNYPPPSSAMSAAQIVSERSRDLAIASCKADGSLPLWYEWNWPLSG